jgi:hypothetical protein
MPTRRFVLTAWLGLVPATSALAQPLSSGPVPPPPADVPLPEPGTVPPPPRPPRAPVYDEEDAGDGISARAAIRIARRRGVVDVERVRRGREVWIVSGTDEYGDDIRVVVNDDGYVVDVRRD